ncbi:MAG TPA: hypothetical protein VGI46_09335 [Candidatus Acidoferrum sp.]|jgi:hypothetical protein
MKKLFAIVLFVLWAVPSNAQKMVMQQRCEAQACAFSSWKPNRAGDLLVAIIRPTLKAPIPCETSPAGCGNSLYMVSDLNENGWRRAYTSWTSEVWYALDAKPGTNIVGVMASVGYGGAGENSTGGDFSFDVVIAEYPPALGLDSTSWGDYYKGEGDTWPRSGSLTATTSKTLLVGWSNNRAVNNGEGPLKLTPDSPEFTVESDDGYLAVADAMVFTPGSYSFSGEYNGYCLWTAGIVAFKMK